MSLTAKAGGGHDAPWVVIPDPHLDDISRGAEDAVRWQRDYIIELMGYDRASVASLTLHELFLRMVGDHAAAAALVTQLGAQVTGAEKRTGGGRKPAAKKPGTPPPAGVPSDEAAQGGPVHEEPEAPVHEFQPVLDAIEAATSKRELRAILIQKFELGGKSVTGQEAFANADVQAAAKAKSAVVAA